MPEKGLEKVVRERRCRCLLVHMRLGKSNGAESPFLGYRCVEAPYRSLHTQGGVS